MDMEIPTFDEIYKQINKNLRNCGIGYSTLGFKFYVPFFVVFLIVAMEISFFVSRISSENILEITELTPYIGSGILGLIKIFCIAVKRYEIFKLMKSLKRLYQDILNDPHKRAIVAKDIVAVTKFTKLNFIINAILICVHNFCPLVIITFTFVTKGYVQLLIPYRVLVPFSTSDLPGWLAVYIHSVTAGFICVYHFTTVDTLYYNLTSNVCCQFKVLCDEIKNLNSTKTYKLTQLVQRHQYILKLSEDLDKIFTYPNFANILLASIDICAIGFNTLFADWAHFPGFCLFLLCKFIQIFLMCVFGEQILQESAKVGDAAFMCEWYTMELRYKKCILIIIIRSQKAQKLTAYKFSTICHKSFTKIISTSWSYFTILRTVYKSPNNI